MSYVAPEQDRQQLAAARLKELGARVTAARVQVLACLLGADRALSHHDVEAALGPRPMDRVTLYRVLDWLVEQGVAHRLAGADRVYRFATAHGDGAEHPHFECSRCGRTLCLAQALPGEMRVPDGFRVERTEITVRGICASCCEIGGEDSTAPA